jgi:hypothetical protein
MDDDDDYLDSLRRERRLPLRGKPLDDSNPDRFDRQVDGGYGMAFAATPPEFGNRTRTRSSNSRDTRFDTRTDTKSSGDARTNYWKNNHAVLVQEEWGTIRAKFPVIPPITEIVNIKNSVYNSFVTKVESARGDWKDRTEFFLAKFEEIVPSASLQTEMAIRDLDNVNSNVFTFSDMEILDTNMATLGRGPGADFPVATRQRTRFLKFTITVHPRNINPGAIDLDPQVFPLPTATTVYVRALLENGHLAPGLSKQLMEMTPKLVLAFYLNTGTEFDICIKERYDAAPDPEKYETWIKAIKAKTKFHACKQYIQKLFVGRMEGTETLGQRLVNIKQRSFDPITQRAHYRSVQELSQAYQFILSEIKSTTQPTELPELDNIFVQAISEDLRKRLVRHLDHPPSTTIDANLQSFNDIIELAIQEEAELKTVTNIAERAAHRASRPYGNRGNPIQPRAPRTFLTTHGGEQEEQRYREEEENSYRRPNTFTAVQLCDSFHHSTGQVIMPICFLTRHNNNISTDQQDLMAEAILAMEMVTVEELPLVATSIVEGALQQASGTRIPIKCFGCSGLPKYDANSLHLWRACPNKGDQDVWKNFQVNLKKFREEKQARQGARQQQGQYGGGGNYGGRQGYGAGQTMINWERDGFPSKQVHDQVHAIADERNTAEVRMTLLSALKSSLNGFEESTELPQNKPKKSRWKGNGRSFLMYMSPKEITKSNTPLTLLGAPPREKYHFKISFKLPFITFPIGDGRTSEDTATLSGLLDTGGCCNMGWLKYHKTIAEKFPQLVQEFVCLEEQQYEQINIGGLKDGVTITHMIKYAIPFTEKGEQLYLTLGLTEDLPIDTLYGLGFQQDAKMKIDFASRKVESALLQEYFDIEFKEPRRTHPDSVQDQERNTPKSLITTDE